MPFSCSICGEEATHICARCTKDVCSNHLCEKCLKCSDCCECEVALHEAPLAPPVRSVMAAAPEPPAEPHTSSAAAPSQEVSPETPELP